MLLILKIWNTWKILRCITGKVPLRCRPFWLLREGYRGFCLGKNFSPKPLVIEFFSWHTTVLDLFSSFVHLERYFCHQVLSCKNFFLLKSVYMILFLKSPIHPQKSNGRPLSNHLWEKEKSVHDWNCCLLHQSVLQAVSQSRILSIRCLIQVHCVRKLKQ